MRTPIVLSLRMLSERAGFLGGQFLSKRVSQLPHKNNTHSSTSNKNEENWAEKLVIYKEPMQVGPLSKIFPSILNDAHHAMVVCRRDDRAAETVPTFDVGKIRELVRPYFYENAACATPEFLKNWSLAWASDEDLIENNILLSAGNKERWENNEPIVFTQLALIPNAPLPRGRYRYSPAVEVLRKVLGAHVYTMTYILGAAIAEVRNLNNSDGRKQAGAQIAEYLLPLDQAMRAQHRNKARENLDWRDTMYSKLRSEIGPAYIRELYGEAPGANEKLERGKQLDQIGRSLGQDHSGYRDSVANIPEVAREFERLKTIVGLLLRADRMHRDGEKEARREFSKARVEDGGDIALPFHIRRAIMHGYRELTGETPPSLACLASIAFDYDFDASPLFPSKGNWVFPLRACCALGRISRLNKIEGWTPKDWWGLKGLSSCENYDSLEDNLLEFLPKIKVHLGHPVIKQILDLEPCIVFTPLLEKQVRNFLSEHDMNG